jgi:hypothetical protein
MQKRLVDAALRDLVECEPLDLRAVVAERSARCRAIASPCGRDPAPGRRSRRAARQLQILDDLALPLIRTSRPNPFSRHAQLALRQVAHVGRRLDPIRPSTGEAAFESTMTSFPPRALAAARRSRLPWPRLLGRGRPVAGTLRRAAASSTARWARPRRPSSTASLAAAGRLTAGLTNLWALADGAGSN